MSRVAKVKVSYELLRQCLFLPENCQIVQVENSEHFSETAELYIISPDFPEKPEGAKVPEAKPIFLRQWNGKSEPLIPAVLKDWGLPK